MSAATLPEKQTSEKQSFAETAMRLSGKSEDEARRIGAVDKADEQVEDLFAAKHQTANSPIHKAVWDGKTPLEMFQFTAKPASASCEAVMEKSLGVAKKHADAGTLYGPNGKLRDEVLDELGRAGYWGLLIDPAYGGHG